MTILLLGSGLAHIEVARRWRQIRGWRVVWIVDHTRYCYSARMAEWIAGHCSRDDVFMDLKPIAEKAGFELVADAAVSLDLAKRQVRTRGGKTFAGQVMSLATGGGEIIGPDDALPL